MRLLLDTHALIWFLQGAPNMPATARQIIADRDADVWISPVSHYEYELQVLLGRITPFPNGLFQETDGMGFIPLAITTAHTEHAGRLPLIHRDPWDRIIAAQAIVEDMIVVTRDPAIATLGARVVW